MTTSHSQTNSRFIAFLDECGDHSLEKIDRDFPLFVLSVIVVERTAYVEQIIPALTKIKLKFWNHEGVNLHSRDIRRALRDFAFMQVPHLRQEMLEVLDTTIKNLPFTLFLAAIDKEKHKNHHGVEVTNLYDLALSYTFKNVANFLKERGEKILPIIAESRGKNEDTELKASFYQLVNCYGELPNFPITFRRKHDNIAGIQIADLCAYPAARKILNPNKTNRAFDAIKPRIYAFNNW